MEKELAFNFALLFKFIIFTKKKKKVHHFVLLNLVVILSYDQMVLFKFKINMLQVPNVANFFMSTKSKTLINDISSHPSQSLSGTHYTSVIDNNLAIVTH